MADFHLQKMSEVLINYSLAVKPGQKLRVRGYGHPAPLLRYVFREAVKAGAHVSYEIYSDELVQAIVRYGKDDQLDHLSEIDMFAINDSDLLLAIGAEANPKSKSGLDSKRMAQFTAASAPWVERYMTRAAQGELRWCYTLFPTMGYAQAANMALEDYEDFVYGAMLLDKADPVAEWRSVHDQQQHLVDYLTAHDQIHIVAPGTDLTYRVGGRTWMNADGKVNFPDGEIFTGPIENSVNGYVTFSYPAIWLGREVEGVRLEYQDGKCVKATADRGEEYLNAMLDMDEGGRYVGEVAFGLNYGIQRFTRHLLFDEKIGGTMHMAMGASYPETGGLNKSGLHWDMVCDLHEGKVYADGTLCYDSGKFIV